ncbi:COP9 signalosome complex subunit 7b [Paramecium bursaria]
MLQYTEDNTTYQFSQYINICQVLIIQYHQNDQDRILFELFAYGTLNDVKIQLTPKQLEKLRILTLISYAQSTHKVKFQTISEICFLQDLGQVEEFILDVLDKKLIIGKIYQKEQYLLVERVVSRDVKPTDVEKLKEKIQTIRDNIKQIKKQF